MLAASSSRDVTFDHKENKLHAGSYLKVPASDVDTNAENKEETVVTEAATAPVPLCSMAGVINAATNAATSAKNKAEAEMKSASYLLSACLGRGAVVPVLWVLPALLAAGALTVQSCMGHVATFYYIRYMARLDDLAGSFSGKIDGHRVDGQPTGEDWIIDYHLDYPQKLQDITASTFETIVEVPLWVLDLLMFPVPAICLSLVVWRKDLYMWTKLMVVNAGLAAGKAFCSVATVIPDSQGWQACKERLTINGRIPDAISQIQEARMDWHESGVGSLLKVLRMELTGVRYCGDMIYSAQTFTILLYSLGLWEVLRRANWSLLKVAPVGLLLAALVCSCAVLSLLARYHYTVDVFLAVLLTLFMYDSRVLHNLCTWTEKARVELAQTGDQSDNELREMLYTDDTPSEETRTWTELFSLCMGCAQHVVNSALDIWNMVYYFRRGETIVAYIYIGSWCTVGFLMTALAIEDSFLALLRWFVKLPVVTLLGFTRLIYCVKLIEAYTEGLGNPTKVDDVVKVRLIQGVFAAAPLAVTQLFAVLIDPSLVHWSIPWCRQWISIVMSFNALGGAFAAQDMASSSVFSQRAKRKAAFQGMLSLFRMAEVGSRICMLVGLQVIFGHVHAGIALGIFDFVVGGAVTVAMGNAKHFVAVVSYALMSSVSNYHLTTKDNDCRRQSDYMQCLRSFEFLVILGGMAYIAKFDPTGYAAQRLGERKELVVLFITLLTLYGLSLASLLEVRRRHAPERLNDDAEE